MAFDFNKIKEENTPGTKTNLEKLAGELADMNYKSFTESEDYASLAKRYSQYGQKAMDDTIGKVAARTGGLASSYATAAGNQAYNDYMSKLEDAARSAYDSQRQEKLDNFGVSQSIYQQNYQKKRDEVADGQWDKQFNTSNAQWNKQFKYTREKDEKERLLQDAQAIWMTGGTLTDVQLRKLGMDRQTEAAYKTYYENSQNKSTDDFKPTMTLEQIQDYIDDLDKNNAFINDLAAKNYYYYYGKYPNYYYGDKYEDVFNYAKTNKDNPEYVAQKFADFWNKNGKSYYVKGVLEKIAQQFGIDLNSEEVRQYFEKQQVIK